MGKNLGGLGHSAVALQPCPLGHITADKRLRYASPKLASATSIPNPASPEMPMMEILMATSLNSVFAVRYAYQNPYGLRIPA